MSSIPTVVSNAAIYSSLRSPFGYAKLTFMSPATSSSAPRGHSLSAATTISIIEVSSGAR